ncbi:MAG: energy transducer TonB [Legionellales bacterium]|nr:energy transducer TonB [Legionellales bacterium]
MLLFISIIHRENTAIIGKTLFMQARVVVEHEALLKQKTSIPHNNSALPPPNLKRTSSQPHRISTHPASTQPKVSGQDFNHLINVLYQQVNQHKFYPELAQTLGQTGVVIVMFDLKNNGSIEHLHVIHSSGAKLLDQAALQAVNAAVPFHGISQQFLSSRIIRLALNYQMSEGD